MLLTVEGDAITTPGKAPMDRVPLEPMLANTPSYEIALSASMKLERSLLYGVTKESTGRAQRMEPTRELSNVMLARLRNDRGTKIYAKGRRHLNKGK